MGLMSSRINRTASITRRTGGRRARECDSGPGMAMPCSVSSSAVPIIAVQSPACTW